MRRWGSGSKLAWPAWIVFASLLLLVASEIGLRVLTDRDSKWNVRLGAALRFDPVAHFRWKSDYRVGDGVYTNENGFLAPRGIRHAKDPNVLRIVYLGDSVSVLPVPGFFPAQVEERLRARGLRVETLNAAVPGYSSESARALFETEVSRYDADWFFILLGWNDLGKYGPEGLPYKRRLMGYRLNPVQELLTHVYTLRLLYSLQDLWRRRQPSVWKPLDGAERALYEAYHPQHFEENLDAILELARSRYPNVRVMNLATITSARPTPSELARAHYPTGMDRNMAKLDLLVGTYNRVIAEVAHRHGVPLIDLHALFDSETARREFTDSCHLDRAGASRVATEITDEISAAPNGG